MSRAALVLVAAFTVAGCSSGPDAKELHAAGRSLVPPSFRIVSERESACVEGKGFPSCVAVYLLGGPQSRLARVRLVEDIAETEGWTRFFPRDVRRDGTGLGYERAELKALINVHERSAAWRRRCRDRGGANFVRSCADAIVIEVK
jgi:hypothetical protein